MAGFLLWCILLVFCWPLALLALVLYPLVWLILLPFRLVGIVVTGVLDFLWGLVVLPGRLLRSIGRARKAGTASPHHLIPRDSIARAERIGEASRVLIG